MSTAASKIDIVISMDTTGSMAPCLYQVRNELARLTDLMFTSLLARGVSVRVGVIAQGDYDSASQYITKHIDLTETPDTIRKFITEVEPVNNGWNEGEAYEQVLCVAKTLTWRADAKRALVIVGDDKPHPPNFPGNFNHADWQKEAKDLADLDVAIYGIQCPSLEISRSVNFYKTLSTAHRRGAYVLLSQFAMVSELLIALLYHAGDDTTALAQHEERLISTGTYNRNMEIMFNTLLEREDAGRVALAAAIPATTVRGPARVPVPPGRFQRFPVSADTSIKAFVQTTGAVFKTGRGFYELSKTEEVNQKKEVIIEHIASGEMFSGTDARDLLGLPHTGTANVRASAVPSGYRAFIQSTSANRKLIGGTSFLYELTQL